MKLIVLGCGSSVPDGRSNMAGYWVEAEDLRLLMDCGPGVVPALPRHVDRWKQVTHVFISHMHIDHVIELPALLFALEHALGEGERHDLPLVIVGPVGTLAMLVTMQAALGYEFLDTSFEVNIVELDARDEFPLTEGCTLRTESAAHTTESLAVRIDLGDRSIGYTGDSGPSDDLAGFFSGCDLLVADCSLCEGRGKPGHMSVDQTCQLASEAGVSRLVATHLFPETDRDLVHAYLADHFENESRIADDGLTVEI